MDRRLRDSRASVRAGRHSNGVRDGAAEVGNLRVDAFERGLNRHPVAKLVAGVKTLRVPAALFEQRLNPRLVRRRYLNEVDAALAGAVHLDAFGHVISPMIELQARRVRQRTCSLSPRA
jgi:hypothetical protein